MAKLSAGLLPYRITGGNLLELFLVHPGGPFWAQKDRHVWSVAKGEYGNLDEPSAAAEREFAEELGVPAPPGARIDLGQVKQPSGKLVRVWAIEAPKFEVEQVTSNRFEMEWPRGSGRRRSFPEVDRAQWMPASMARQRLLKGQLEFIDRLIGWLGDTGLPHEGRTGD
ncbi:MAG: NUDIX domain-containing protein [Acidimicrobiales bacterium]